MSATSIHICAARPNSEAHNLREKKLDYVLPELTGNNENYIVSSIADRLAEDKAICKELTGRSMQAKATPIREGVAVITPQTTMQEIKNFGDACKERFGIELIQAHIHRDEGHTNEQGETKINNHAHLIFDWVNHETGKSIKLDKQDMAEMQTMLAHSLNMDRGVSSDLNHLNAIQYKEQAAEVHINDITQHLNELNARQLKAEEQARQAEEQAKQARQNAEQAQARQKAVEDKIKAEQATLRNIQEQSNKSLLSLPRTLIENHTLKAEQATLRSDLNTAKTEVKQLTNDLQQSRQETAQAEHRADKTEKAIKQAGIDAGLGNKAPATVLTLLTEQAKQVPKLQQSISAQHKEIEALDVKASKLQDVATRFNHLFTITKELSKEIAHLFNKLHITPPAGSHLENIYTFGQKELDKESKESKAEKHEENKEEKHEEKKHKGLHL